MEFLKKISAVIWAAIALFCYLLGRKDEKVNQSERIKERTINVMDQAKTSRESLNNVERVKRLHNKYKR